MMPASTEMPPKRLTSRFIAGSWELDTGFSEKEGKGSKKIKTKKPHSPSSVMRLIRDPVLGSARASAPLPRRPKRCRTPETEGSLSQAPPIAPPTKRSFAGSHRRISSAPNARTYPSERFGGLTFHRRPRVSPRTATHSPRASIHNFLSDNFRTARSEAGTTKRRETKVFSSLFGRIKADGRFGLGKGR